MKSGFVIFFSPSSQIPGYYRDWATTASFSTSAPCSPRHGQRRKIYQKITINEEISMQYMRSGS